MKSRATGSRMGIIGPDPMLAILHAREKQPASPPAHQSKPTQPHERYVLGPFIPLADQLAGVSARRSSDGRSFEILLGGAVAYSQVLWGDLWNVHYANSGCVALVQEFPRSYTDSSRAERGTLVVLDPVRRTARRVDSLQVTEFGAVKQSPDGKVMAVVSRIGTMSQIAMYPVRVYRTSGDEAGRLVGDTRLDGWGMRYRLTPFFEMTAGNVVRISGMSSDPVMTLTIP